MWASFKEEWIEQVIASEKEQIKIVTIDSYKAVSHKWKEQLLFGDNGRDSSTSWGTHSLNFLIKQNKRHRYVITVSGQRELRRADSDFSINQADNWLRILLHEQEVCNPYFNPPLKHKIYTSSSAMPQTNNLLYHFQGILASFCMFLGMILKKSSWSCNLGKQQRTQS